MNSQARIRARSASRRAPRLWLALLVGMAAALTLIATRPAAAQDALELVSTEELREIVGPIALYPDDLVAIVLPASTYPLQVVQAARFLEDRERDSSLQANDDWDDSIVALLNYPEVVELMNDDLDWTYDLGTAVLNQRADVLSAIQDFRDEAYAAGNLRSDERQTVARNDEAIEIKPADPEVIYVPYYEPERVVVYQPAPVYYYYPRPYPVYYYPYPAGYRFSAGFFWGVNSWFSIGWHSHHVHVYDPFYYAHPYYGRSYYSPFYVRNVYVNVNHYNRYPNYVWEPRYRYGGRPVVRGSEGRVYTADRAPRSSNGAVTRTREGAAYRANTSGATSTRAATGSRTTTARTTTSSTQPARRDVPSSSAYRSRSIETTERAAQSAQANRATAQPGAATRTSPGVVRATPNTAARTNPGVVRSNPSVVTRATPTVSPRASERSTGMPREASRAAAAPPPSAPAARAPSGGGAGAQRSESGGSYRGNTGGGNGGGSYRGNAGSGGSGSGGSQRAAASSRGGEGRSAAR
jgi:uncharacterized membrane protein YgcG